jgi:hypothetical protein
VELKCLDGSESKQRGRFAATIMETASCGGEQLARARRKGEL